MALFRRGKRGTGPDDQSVDDLPVDDQVAAETGPGDGTGEPIEATADGEFPARFDRSAGPFDVEEIDRADTDLPRIDLGALQIPGIAGLTLQVEADQNTGQISLITAAKSDGAVQLQAFAAPKSGGLWAEIRDEIRAELETGKVQHSQANGPFGPEVRALMPVTTPDGRPAVQPVRFAGIDGPRWFLRVVFLGRAAMEPEATDELHTLVRQTVVVRGPDAMAPRTLLSLRLPPQEGGPGNEDPDDDGPDDGLDDDLDAEFDDDDLEDEGPGSRYSDLNPFERGPEITEIR